MAALLVAIAVITIMMSVAMPVWRHDEQREKEAELIWRGNQYVRAVRLFQAKTRTFPTSVDMLVQGRFLRKKYLDPITNQEFAYLGAGSAAGQPGGGPVQANPGAPGQRGGAPASTNPSGSSLSTNAFGAARGATGQGSLGQASPFAMPATASSVPGGLIGVQSKSTDESIMVYNGRTHYNEWLFLYVAQNPGGGIGGRGSPAGRGRPGGPGANPFPFPPGRGRGGPGSNPFPFPPGNGPGRGRGGPGGFNPFPGVPPGPPGPGRGRGGGL